MPAFKRNILASYSTQAIAVVCNFLCSIMAARMLGTYGQGDLALYTGFSALMMLVASFGLSSGIVYFIASAKISSARLLTTVTTFSIVVLLLLGLALYIPFLHPFFDLVLPEFIGGDLRLTGLLLSHLFFLVFNQYMVAVFNAENNFTVPGIITVCGSIVLLALYAYKYFGTAPSTSNLQYIFYCLAGVGLLQSVLYLLGLFKCYPRYLIPGWIPFHSLKPLLLFSLTAWLANLVQFLNYKVDIWFLNYYHHDKSMIGIYSLAVSLAQLLWLLPNAVHGVLYSDVSGEKDMEIRIKRTTKVFIALLFYAILGGIAGYFLSIYLVPLWFGVDFSSVPALIGILLFGIIPVSAGLALSAFFAGIQKIRINMYGSIIGLLVCVVFNVLLVPSFGATGAAWATVISYGATILYYLACFLKTRK